MERRVIDSGNLCRAYQVMMPFRIRFFFSLKQKQIKHHSTGIHFVEKNERAKRLGCIRRII